MQLKSSLISFNHHFDSPVIPTKWKEADNRKVGASFFFCLYGLLFRWVMCWLTRKTTKNVKKLMKITLSKGIIRTFA